MSELGPYYPTPDGRLQENLHAWNQVANIIFLDSPAFVGWSYSNTTTDIVVGMQHSHMWSSICTSMPQQHLQACECRLNATWD